MILEDNAKLAEYLGYKIANKQKELRATFAKRYILSENSLIAIMPKKGNPNTGSVTIFDPSSDWNQLMEVVERIEKDATVTIEQDYCYIKLYNDLGIIENEVWKKGNIKREAVYQAVLEYITQKEVGNG